MRWGVRQRLEFIEFRLQWEETINRKDIINQFDVSVPQASNDLKQYKKIAPKNMRYNRKAKQYSATSNFEPVLISTDAKSYLAQLQMYAEGAINRDDLLLGFLPDFEVLHSIERSINPSILKKVIGAIKKKRAVNVYYQSMTRPSPTLRWITPHALAHDGFRWHIRAFCELRSEFRDFILGRIISVENEKKRKIEPSEDIRWNQYVTMVITPSPELSESQKAIIEQEYGMVEGKKELTVRGALVYYVIRRFRLEREDDTRFTEQRNLLLFNREEVEEYL